MRQHLRDARRMKPNPLGRFVLGVALKHRRHHCLVLRRHVHQYLYCLLDRQQAFWQFITRLVVTSIYPRNMLPGVY